MRQHASLIRYGNLLALTAPFLLESVGCTPPSPADNMRLHRAHRIAWIVGGEGVNFLCFRMDQLSTEYANKYLGR
jgi:hypothetical protein